MKGPRDIRIRAAALLWLTLTAAVGGSLVILAAERAGLAPIYDLPMPWGLMGSHVIGGLCLSLGPFGIWLVTRESRWLVGSLIVITFTLLSSIRYV